MSVKDVGLGGTVWIRAAQEKKPAVPKPAKTEAGNKKPGSDDPSRETSDYSEEKQAEAHTYRFDKDGAQPDEPENIGSNIDLDI
ncbi:MAG: hypothetical protein ACRBCK_02420 [Alphaproteobacteria bacterium]